MCLYWSKYTNGKKNRPNFKIYKRRRIPDDLWRWIIKYKLKKTT